MVDIDHEAASHSPRAIIKAQIERLNDQTPISGYNENYNILQATKEEHVMRRFVGQVAKTLGVAQVFLLLASTRLQNQNHIT